MGRRHITLRMRESDAFVLMGCDLNGDNISQRRAASAAIKAAVEQELTVRQRQVIIMYYVNRLNIPEIAVELGLNKSTVSRHMKRAHERLRRVLKYSYCPARNDS